MAQQACRRCFRWGFLPWVAVLLAAVLAAACGGAGGPAPSRHELAYFGIDGALLLVDADTGATRKLADEGTCGRFSSLSWSPTGHRLVCASGEDRLVLRDAEGRVVGELEMPGMGPPYWSPSGSAFLFWTIYDPELDGRDVTYQLFVADDSGSLLAELGPWDPGRLAGWSYRGFPLWSPDGSQLAYRTADTSETHIYSVDTAEGGTLAGDYRPLAWALDGQALLVAANYQPPPVPMAFPSYEVSLLELSSGEMMRLPVLDDGVQFWVSPDGSHAVYLISSLTPVRGGTVPGLGVLDLGSGESKAIPNSIITYGSDAIPQEWVTFSRDGKYVYWVGGDNAGYRARIDGTGLTKLLELEDEYAFRWSPDFQMIAYTHYRDYYPMASLTLYVAKSDGTEQQIIASREASALGAIPPFGAVWRPDP